MKVVAKSIEVVDWFDTKWMEEPPQMEDRKQLTK